MGEQRARSQASRMAALGSGSRPGEWLLTGVATQWMGSPGTGECQAGLSDGAERQRSGVRS